MSETKEAEVKSEWRGEQLWWRVDDHWVSDLDLRAWCYQNMPYPSNHIDVVRRMHTDAWAAAHKESPAAVQPAPQPTLPPNPPTGYCPHGYAARENCDKCFMETRASQPAGGAGEKCKHCRLLKERHFEQLGRFPCPIIIDGKFYKWSTNSEYEPQQQPCPRCAELERERGLHECGCEVCSTTSKLCPATSSSYALEILSLRAERDTLQAKVAALEKALGEIKETIETREPGSALLCLAIANAALGEKEA